MEKNRYFGTDGIRGRVGQFPIVPEFIFKIGWAVGRVFFRYVFTKVAIGKDTRISSHMLESVLSTGLFSSGMSVMFTGSIPTPAIAYLTYVLHDFVGIIISASHNPFHDNGVKFFIKGFKLSMNLEKEIEAELDKNINFSIKFLRFSKLSGVVDIVSRYIEFCRSTFPSYLNLKSFKIVLDCANGSAYNVAPDILYELGATVKCLGCQPDGTNINQGCGTTDIRQLQNLVLQEQANLGIAYDGDADRVIMVDHLGNKVDGDQILYILARERQRNFQLFGGVVGTQMSNIGLELALKTLGIPFIRSYVGDRYVFSMMRRKNWYLGGENSGHILLLDKSPTGDAIIVCLQVLLAMINNQICLYDLCQGIHLLPQVLFNVPCIYSQDFFNSSILRSTLQEVRSELGKFGRILLRVSGTEPCIRIMVEGECYNQIIYLANQIVNVLHSIK